MINNDIPNCWDWLESMDDDRWRITVNHFLKWAHKEYCEERFNRQISYMGKAFTRWQMLRKDFERIHQEELSVWFCSENVKELSA